MKTIYLAGKITGLSYAEATEWRSRVTKDLSKYYRILDPMRDKKCLENCDRIDTDLDSDGVTNAEIFSRDLADIDKSDIVIVNLLGGASIGTYWEMGYVWGTNHHICNPRLLYIVADKAIADHPFIEQSGLIQVNKYGASIKHGLFDSLEDCVIHLFNKAVSF